MANEVPTFRNRREAINAARSQKAYIKEANRPSGITRYEDGPRIPSYERRRAETEFRQRGGRAQTATEAGYEPNRVQAATGRLLQDRRAFAEDLRKKGGTLDEETLKRAGMLDLDRKALSSFFKREGIKAPVAASAASAPASATATPAKASSSPTASPASPEATPRVAGSTAVGMPAIDLTSLKSDPASNAEVLGDASRIGASIARIAGVNPSTIAKFTDPIDAATKKVAAAAAPAAPTGKPLYPRPTSKIGGIPADEFLRQGYREGMKAFARGEGPRPFYDEKTMGPRWRL